MMKKDNITYYADLLGAMGSTVRLMIIRLLVKHHPHGLLGGEIQAKLQIAASSLFHHLEKLKQQGLVQVRKENDQSYYSADTKVLEDLLAFFYAECCVRQQVIDWSKAIERKEQWLLEELTSSKLDQDNFEHLIEPAIYERLGGKAMQVLLLARFETIRLQHNFIGTEQILLGLLGEGSGDAARILKSWGMSLNSTRQAVKEIIGEGRGSGSEIPFTPKAQKVLHLALEESHKTGQILINTEHFLLALIREWKTAQAKGETLSVASLLLSKLGLEATEMEAHLK